MVPSVNFLKTMISLSVDNSVISFSVDNSVNSFSVDNSVISFSVDNSVISFSVDNSVFMEIRCGGRIEITKKTNNKCQVDIVTCHYFVLVLFCLLHV